MLRQARGRRRGIRIRCPTTTPLRNSDLTVGIHPPGMSAPNLIDRTCILSRSGSSKSPKTWQLNTSVYVHTADFRQHTEILKAVCVYGCVCRPLLTLSTGGTLSLDLMTIPFEFGMRRLVPRHSQHSPTSINQRTTSGFQEMAIFGAVKHDRG